MPHLMPNTPVRFDSAPHVRGLSGGSASGGSTTGLGLRGISQGFSSAALVLRRGASACGCTALDNSGAAADVEAPAAKPRSDTAGSGAASSLAQALTARRAMPPGGAAF